MYLISTHLSFLLLLALFFHLHLVEKASPLKPMPPRKNKLKTRPLLSPDERAKILQKQKDILSPTVSSIVPNSTSLPAPGTGYDIVIPIESNQENNDTLPSSDSLSSPAYNFSHLSRAL